ncbi:hypothetical protein chiPu_0025252, partial [Chiloscyllium punctatum]|nr:hypothetical protein [Chiloscyllium punctatum]
MAGVGVRGGVGGFGAMGRCLLGLEHEGSDGCDWGEG